MNEDNIKQLIKDEIKKFLWSWQFVAIIMSVIIISVAISLALVWI
jgi:hypothetical protein